MTRFPTSRLSPLYAGILIFQARDNTRALSVSGNDLLGTSGTIYAKAALLSLSGNARVQQTLVVNTLSITGNGSSSAMAEGEGNNNTVGQLLAADLHVYVNNANGLFDANELSRISDAIAGLDSFLAPYGVSVTQTEVGDGGLANVVLDTRSTSASGTAADGVLGCETDSGEITLLQGWNWYAGADPAAIGRNQYDFQAIVTHELGHALGLGHSPNPDSVMNGTLSTGAVHRALIKTDLGIPDADDGGAHALHASLPSASGEATEAKQSSVLMGKSDAQPGGPVIAPAASSLPVAGLFLTDTRFAVFQALAGVAGPQAVPAPASVDFLLQNARLPRSADGGVSALAVFQALAGFAGPQALPAPASVGFSLQNVPLPDPCGGNDGGNSALDWLGVARLATDNPLDAAFEDRSTTPPAQQRSATEPCRNFVGDLVDAGCAPRRQARVVLACTENEKPAEFQPNSAAIDRYFSDLSVELANDEAEPVD